MRVDTPGRFSWTISNLHYPSDTYSVALDAGGGSSIVVSTSNKKWAAGLDALAACCQAATLLVDNE